MMCEKVENLIIILVGIHERPIHWSWTILWYSLIPLIGGMLFAYFFLYLEKIFTRVETWALPALLKATLWGIVLSVLTLVTDYALFFRRISHCSIF